MSRGGGTATRPLMRYISTRGRAPALDFRGVTLAGLASDGGLYVPESWPRWDADEIAALAGLSYAETAARVLAPFVGDALTPAELLALCEQAYGRFAHAAVTPLVQLDHDQWLLELFHGPTLAFKDVALQLLGLLFERFMETGEQPLTVIGATSGDTGSAAIDALAGRAGVEVFMLHPAGRVTEVQRRQMTTVAAPNIQNIAIAGTFDDAQALVKAMFADAAMTRALRLSAVNSINWARLAAQVVYYAYASIRLSDGGPVHFSVPTGNFGDVFAGYVAKRMGFPIGRLIVATNVNDVIARALANGDYSRGAVQQTATPSMDIQVSSNFERLLFEGAGRDGAALAAQMGGFEATGAMRLTNAQTQHAAQFVVADSVDANDMMTAMRWAHERGGQVIDPHTGIALAAARRAGLDGPVVTLATAHPAKFGDTVERATGLRPPLPARVGDLFERQERYTTLAGTYEAVSGYVLEHAAR